MNNPVYEHSTSSCKTIVAFATFCATGITSSPPIASVCICANWNMPGVMNRYIRFENAGDMYVGRLVCAHNRMGHKTARHREIDDWIKNRMTEDARSNENVYPLIKTCLASCFSCNLHHRSAAVLSPFYSEPVTYADHVLLGIFGILQKTRQVSLVCRWVFCTWRS
jgi:hypothetical protein